jgi:pimeloyl-ACP methyl ester carboxylesterase
MEDMKPRFEVVDLGDSQLSTATWGDGVPEIVLLHDGLGSINQWRSVPGDIAQRLNCTVIAYDRAGHGSSIPSPTTVRPADWLHAEADELEVLLGELNIEEPILVGHSDGATIALIYGSQNATTRGIVAIAAHSWVEQVAVSRIIGMRADPQPVMKGLARHHSDPLALFESWSRTWSSTPFQSWDTRAILDTLDAPTLVVQGVDDEFATDEQVFATAAAIGPNATPLLLPGQPHLIHHERPQVVVDLVTDFVRSIDAR